ncbi:MAG: hypothetical protein NTX72_04880 [Candidatus Uhrbacteria bacterium]|nr:hypothetical protein [Candidatus Uhrbacteria bacterium]
MQLTVEALRDRFAGKTIVFSLIGPHGLYNDYTQTIGCVTFDAPDEAGYMHVLLKDGLRWTFKPDTRTIDSVEGACDRFHGFNRLKIQIVASLKSSIERKAALEAEAMKVWTDLAKELAFRIPESCRKFANENGWYKGELDGFWTLPRYLEDMARNTKGGGCNSDKFYENNLEPYGFKNFDDLEIKLKELEHAWAGLMRIDVRKGEGYRVEVCYYAVEFEPKKDEPAV